MAHGDYEKLTPEAIDELWVRLRSGKAAKPAARELGLGTSTVRAYLLRCGGIRPEPRRRVAGRLTLAEREEISRGLAAGHSLRRIAAGLGRAPSTISREVAANGGARRYRAARADRQAWSRGARPKPCRLATGPVLRDMVEETLQRRWSPQQIAGWLKLAFPTSPEMQVSHETIYRTLFVQSRGALRRELTRYLRTGRVIRRPKGVRMPDGRGGRPNILHISERPLIRAEFGPLPIGSVRPSMVRSWLARLREDGKAQSYVYALHARLSQLFSDAVHDGVLARNPCSRRTSPGAGKQRAYVATTEQVWSLCEAVSEQYRLAVLLGAFAGLRIAEACGLRPGDVNFLRREIHPAVQWPAEPLKTAMAREVVPIADALVAEISAQVARYPGDTLLRATPWTIEREIRKARAKIDGLSDGFRFHDLRHYYASLLIASGADVKVVQHRLRHASAKTTLDTYGHLWPDTDESRTAVERVMSARLADSLRTGEATK